MLHDLLSMVALMGGLFAGVSLMFDRRLQASRMVGLLSFVLWALLDMWEGRNRSALFCVAMATLFAWQYQKNMPDKPDPLSRDNHETLP